MLDVENCNKKKQIKSQKMIIIKRTQPQSDTGKDKNY